MLRRIERTAAAGGAVPVQADHFWAVPPDRPFDLTEEPDELTVRQLSESRQHLRNPLAVPDRALGHHPVRLADVLHAIGREPPRSMPGRPRPGDAEHAGPPCGGGGGIRPRSGRRAWRRTARAGFTAGP
ncbi:hypothetical protein [Streptomyces sp. NPDC101206]|uniref:hypothetical protein n=1 Tax=Streptomyces sp. NPDC101206 TaxID=3366128 RepID=UPI00381AED04